MVPLSIVEIKTKFLSLFKLKKLKRPVKLLTSGQKTSLLVVFALALLLPLFVFAARNQTVFKSKAASLGTESLSEQVTKKVLLLNFNPIIEAEGNQRLNTLMGWNDANTLSANVIADLVQDSGGYINYEVADSIEIDDFPVKEDGFQYTDQSYLDCIATNSTCHSPDGVNYLKILDDYDICEQRNAGTIDEVWIWGGPWFGYYESLLAGPGAFWYNSPPLLGTTCQKLLPIMGLNYERAEAEVLESYGHRVESALLQANGGWNNQNPATDWDRFTLIDSHPADPAACGNVHFPPNGLIDYDYANSNFVTSSCLDWVNYPNLTGQTTSLNCSTWSCSHRGFLNWWYTHLPKADGYYGTTLANWWKYVVDYEAALVEEEIYTGVGSSIIANPSDDVDYGCAFYQSRNEIYLGQDANCSPNSPYLMGLRFSGINIPQGETIHSAAITFTADGPYSDPVTTTIAAENAGNPPAFSAEHTPAQVVLTSAQTPWDIATTWQFSQSVLTPDITAVIQELVNRPDWVPGSSVNIVISTLSGTNHRRLFAYERDSTQVATLNYTWGNQPTPSPSPSPTPTSSPSPTPKPGRKPQIITTSLPSATAGQRYTATIQGKQSVQFYPLTMAISGLPTGIKVRPCTFQNSDTQTTITCNLLGKATTAGTYDVSIVLTDSAGSSSSVTLPLTVQP